MRHRVDGPPVLYELIPSRHDDDPGARARALFAGLAGADGIALEAAVTDGTLRFYLRSATTSGAEAALGQLRASHPQCGFRPVDAAHDDPLWFSATDESSALELRLMRHSAFPIETDARHGDLFAGVLAAALAASVEGDRIVCQLSLCGSPSHRWAANVQARSARQLPAYRPATASSASTDLLPLVGLAGFGALGIQAVRWYEGGDTLPLLGLGAGVVMTLPLAATVWSRVASGREPLTPALVDEKLSFPRFKVRLRVIAIGDRDPTDLRRVAEQIAATYQAFDHPAGNGLRPRRANGDAARLSSRNRLSGRDTILNAAELASLWHLPDPTVLPVAERPVARRLLPAEGLVSRGCRVGVSRHQGRSVPVHVPRSALFRNHLILAKTRRGKSTFLQHLASHLMQELDSGRERLLLVVIDPHQDLAESVLSVVPPGIEDRAAYLNLTDRERPVGLNLLDVALFPNRDRTAENIVAMLHRLWPDNWGPRMEGALRAALLSLHQANQVRRRGEQYTLLDVVPLLTSAEFRQRVMSQVPDQTLWAWWHDNYDQVGRAFQQQIANPVTTKVGRFQVTEAARLTLGQAQSTFNPRALLRDGGVLVVNSAVGLLGEGGAALIGATILNLLSLIVEDQIEVPEAERSQLVALVDESSTLGGADYPRMMSELGKYGASFVLVTQSLAKLDAIDAALRPTVFANIDSLTVFQVSAEDARYLTPELGGDLEVADLVSQDDYECYARWSSNGHRNSAFSLHIDPPTPSDTTRIAAIAGRSAEQFGRSRAEVAREVDRVLTNRGIKAGQREFDGWLEPPEPVGALAGNGALPVRPKRNEHRDRRR